MDSLPYKISGGLFLFFLLVCLNCQKDKTTDNRWYKGNLHTHSYWSDGDEFPEMIMDWYKSNGYQFVALSDHNILAEGQKWVKIPKARLYQEAFEQYLEKYGPKWVEYIRDTSGLRVHLKTYEEYRPLFERENSFLIIQSEEITDNYLDLPIHLNATNIQSLIPPQGGESVVEVLQNNIDAVLKQRQETGQPILPHINHPNFGYALSVQDLSQIEGERFFEIYNGHPQVNNYGDSTHISVEEMWDLVNIAYIEKNQPLLYGIATDDSHHYHLFGSQYSNAGRGWIMVQAGELSADSLIEAMEAGRFYASTGVVLKKIGFDGKTLEVAVRAEAGISYDIQFIGVESQERVPRILKQETGRSASFELDEDILFVRAKIVSNKFKENPYQEGEVEKAWTQPVVRVRD